MIKHVILTGLCVLSSPAFAQEDGSTWSLSLDSVTVRSHRHTSPLKYDRWGIPTWSMNHLQELPQILGNADPMHYAQMMPGIQTNNEYRSGIHIEGSENQHNLISIEGVPLYNVSHLLGFFSVFNSSHFAAMSMTKGNVVASAPNRLGGQLDMKHTATLEDSTRGSLSVSLMSSQGTIRFPLGRHTAMAVSLRGSYLNLLYSRWIRTESQQVRYSFYDANVSISHRINARNSLLFDYYGGSDNCSFSEGNYLAQMKARWGNEMAAVHWSYENNEVATRTTAYLTSYRNNFRLKLQDNAFQLPSSITDIGLKSHFFYKTWQMGAELIWHDIRPQAVSHSGSFAMQDHTPPPLRSQETSLFADYTYEATPQLSLSGGLKGSVFAQSATTYSSLAPSLRISYTPSRWQIAAAYTLRHQYLFQTGFSDAGLPTEFWISASPNLSPQYAHIATLSASRYFLGRKYRGSADLFYRKLFHQLGNKGSVFDHLNSVYDFKAATMNGQGMSYGLSLMLHKCTGALTGWIGYTYTHSRRSFEEVGRTRAYPASHERPHEWNAVATYAFGRQKRWSLGATAIYASGTPFTAAEALLLLNNNLLIKYGDYNAARLRPYKRLDLSINYQWREKRGREQSINFSLYNVTSSKNELFYYLKTRKDGSFAYRPVSFVFNILPSISYSHKF